MDMFRYSMGWEQKLMVTFRARSLDLGEIAEDVIAVAPSARFACDERGEGGDGRPEMADVSMELPDDAALLNRVIGVIFHAQGSLPPAIKVQRVFGRHAAAIAAAA